MVLLYTGEQVSKYGVFSGPYFPVLSPNTGKYGIEKVFIFGHFSPSFISTGFFKFTKKIFKGNLIFCAVSYLRSSNTSPF